MRAVSIQLVMSHHQGQLHQHQQVVLLVLHGVKGIKGQREGILMDIETYTLSLIKLIKKLIRFHESCRVMADASPHLLPE